MEEVGRRLENGERRIRRTQQRSRHGQTIRALTMNVLPILLTSLAEQNPSSEVPVCQIAFQPDYYVSIFVSEGGLHLHLVSQTFPDPDTLAHLVETLNVLYDMLRMRLAREDADTPNVTDVRLIQISSAEMPDDTDLEAYSVVKFTHHRHTQSDDSDLLDEFLANDAIINNSPRERLPTSAGGDRGSKKDSTHDKILLARTGPPKSEGIIGAWLRRGKEELNSKRYGIEIDLQAWERYTPEYEAIDKLMKDARGDQVAMAWNKLATGALPDALAPAPAKGKSTKNDVNDFSRSQPGWTNLENLVRLYRDRRSKLIDSGKRITADVRAGKIKYIRSLGAAVASGTVRDPAIPAYVYEFSNNSLLLDYHRQYNVLYGDLIFMQSLEALHARPLSEIYGDGSRVKVEDTAGSQEEGKPNTEVKRDLSDEVHVTLPITKFIYDLDQNFLSYAANTVDKTRTLKKLIAAAMTRSDAYRLHVRYTLGAEHAGRLRRMFSQFGVPITAAYDKQIVTMKEAEAKAELECKKAIAAAMQAKVDMIAKTKRLAAEELEAKTAKVRLEMEHYIETDMNALPSDVNAIFELCHVKDAKAHARLFRDLISVDAGAVL